MKAHVTTPGMEELCGLFGKSRQAYYKNMRRKKQTTMEDAVILSLVAQVRDHMPRLGARKLLHLLAEPLKGHGIELSRDGLFALLSTHGLLLRKRRRKAVTTFSRHRFKKYPNLIRDFVADEPNQLWVSDITYVTTTSGFSYLSLITDGYSRKIIGFCLHPTLSTDGPLEALEMALAQRGNGERLIHHSDRGTQYCSDAYVRILKEGGIAISMTEKGDPYENAIAERVNGILKTEFNMGGTFPCHEKAMENATKSIAIYNGMRPHLSLNYLTPELAHEGSGKLEKKWKNYPWKGKAAPDVNQLSDYEESL